MDIAQAFNLAEELRIGLAPLCERIEVAGSIRRRRPQVKDIELVAIPKWAEVPDDSVQPSLFGGPPPMKRMNLLQDAIERLERAGLLYPIKPGVPGIERWHLTADGKYWRLIASTDLTPLNMECAHEYR